MTRAFKNGSLTYFGLMWDHGVNSSLYAPFRREFRLCELDPASVIWLVPFPQGFLLPDEHLTVIWLMAPLSYLSTCPSIAPFDRLLGHWKFLPSHSIHFYPIPLSQQVINHIITLLRLATCIQQTQKICLFPTTLPSPPPNRSPLPQPYTLLVESQHT